MYMKISISNLNHYPSITEKKLHEYLHLDVIHDVHVVMTDTHKYVLLVYLTTEKEEARVLRGTRDTNKIREWVSLEAIVGMLRKSLTKPFQINLTLLPET